VYEYQGFRESRASPGCRQNLPSTRVPLILNFGPAFRLSGPGQEWSERTSLVAGVHDRYALDASTGASYCMQVDLTPIGAHRLLGLPMDELANRVVELDDVLGVFGRRLTERLEALPDWEARFALLERTISERIDRAREPTAGVVWAYDRLVASGGNAGVAALASELGWSRRRLAVRFREQVGMPPKTIARLLRFERALELLGSDGVGFAEVAVRCGYFDQAHLARDVRAFADATPSDLARRRRADTALVADGVPFVQV
jgi:AraC-like DNA-binding protein